MRTDTISHYVESGSGADCPCATEHTWQWLAGIFISSLLVRLCTLTTLIPSKCPKMSGSARLVVGQTIGGLAPAEVMGVHREERQPSSSAFDWLRVPL